MACFQPLLAVNFSLDYYTGKCSFTKEDGKQLVKILPRRAGMNLKDLRVRYGKQLMMLPCGHCVACAQDYARTWQARIMCEAEYYEKNVFSPSLIRMPRKPS